MSELFTFEGFKIEDEICHYGIKGQKWGVRRYQNPDGSLTPAGKARYGNQMTKEDKKALRKEIKSENKKAKELEKEALSIAQSMLMSFGKRKVKLKELYDAKIKEIDNHTKELIKKYGKDAIESIKTNKNGIVKPSESFLINNYTAHIANQVHQDFLMEQLRQQQVNQITMQNNQQMVELHNMLNQQNIMNMQMNMLNTHMF